MAIASAPISGHPRNLNFPTDSGKPPRACQELIGDLPESAGFSLAVSLRMRASFITRAFGLVAVAALFAGCAAYNYDLAVKNVGTSEVWCSSVTSFRGMAHEPGRLIPGAAKTIAGPFRVPYRDHWTVSWRTASGREVTRNLDLKHKRPAPFEGRLVFTIDDRERLGFFTEPFQAR